MFTLRTLLSATLTLSTLVSSGDEPTLQERLEKLSQTLEAARQEAHVPGMSIAIVEDDEVVFARGFGLADVAAERPADEETIYAIGSTTKAFTATLMGMLVDEGEASWDDPVTDYLPYFDLKVKSDDESARVTLRDLLSHRHGFARMGLLWISGNVSRENVLRTAAGAEPWDDFRENFHYCNVTYLAAGEAAGVAAESTWDRMIVGRIFEPLGMTASTLSAAEAQEDPRLAIGYRWSEVREEFEPKPMVDLQNIGPAGAINSNVLDMARWVRLQLGRGEVDGMRLITAERIEETWSPQVSIGGGASYGLGWMLREHDGRKVVEHGGNIGGFSAQVGLLPEEGLGYVLLMNLEVSPLQQSSLAMVFDALLAEWPDEGAAAESGEIDFEDYTGVYVANFASFRDEEFEVLINGDRLALDIPSQMTFDLQPPDEEGRWSFVMTDQIAVSFQRDDQGAVIGLTVHQGGYDFEVPRKGVETEPEAPVEELEKYVGTYVREEGGRRVEITIVQGRLALEDRGNVLAFRTPDADGHAPLRARPDHGATFEIDAEGNVESFVFHGEAGDKLFTRMADSPDTELPTLDDVLALRDTEARIAALERAGGTRVTGKVWVAQAGIRGEVTIYTQDGDRFANHMDFGEFGEVDVVSRGGEAWSFDPMNRFDELEGDELTQALLEHPAAIEGDWNLYFDSVEVLRNDTVDERPVHVVRLGKGDLPSRTYWIDAETGDVLRVKQVTVQGPIRVPVTIDYSDYEEIDGIRRPRRVEIQNPASGKMVLTFEDVQSGLELGDEVFTLLDPDAKGD